MERGSLRTPLSCTAMAETDFIYSPAKPSTSRHAFLVDDRQGQLQPLGYLLAANKSQLLLTSLQLFYLDFTFYGPPLHISHLKATGDNLLFYKMKNIYIFTRSTYYADSNFCFLTKTFEKKSMFNKIHFSNQTIFNYYFWNSHGVIIDRLISSRLKRQSRKSFVMQTNSSWSQVATHTHNCVKAS